MKYVVDILLSFCMIELDDWLPLDQGRTRDSLGIGDESSGYDGERALIEEGSMQNSSKS